MANTKSKVMILIAIMVLTASMILVIQSDGSGITSASVSAQIHCVEPSTAIRYIRAGCEQVKGESPCTTAGKIKISC